MYFAINSFFLYYFFVLFYISLQFLTTNIRLKLVLFTLCVFYFSILGFLFDLDGIMLILLITEVTAVMFLLMTYMQLYSSKWSTSSKNFSFFLIFFILIALFVNPLTLWDYEYSSYYESYMYIVSSDFFILYHLLFHKLWFVTICLILIITFFSLFFIILYFNLKSLKHNKFIKNKQVLLLRKQNFTKQTKSTKTIFAFQD